MNIDFNELYKKTMPFLLLFVLAFVINNIAFYFLPKKTIDYKKQDNTSFKYIDYSVFKDMANVNKEKKQKVIQKDYISISNLSLNAVYSKYDNSGWAIVKEKSKSKSYILKQNDVFKSYKLKKLFSDYVIFTKNSKEYKLTLLKNKTKFNLNSKNIKNIVKIKNVYIKRSLLNSYIKDTNKLQKELKFSEIRYKGLLSGLRITNIKNSSLSLHLKLKNGDIIKEINNKKFTNYNKVIEMYKQLQKSKYLKLSIIRNNTQMELNYEIN